MTLTENQDLAVKLKTSSDAGKGVTDLSRRVDRAVREATGDRIQNLYVHISGTHVILDGYCSTFHCNQIAQHAAMRSAEDLGVENRIEVL